MANDELYKIVMQAIAEQNGNNEQAPVAQRLEPSAHNGSVPGSNPGGSTKGFFMTIKDLLVLIIINPIAIACIIGILVYHFFG